MQRRTLVFVVLVLCNAVVASVRGQTRDSKDSFAELTPLIHHDFCAAVMIHPARIAQSPFGKSIALTKLVTAALQHPKVDKRVVQLVDPAKISRLTLLVDPFPGGNVAFFPAVVVEYEQDTPGGELLRALWPDSRPSAEDKRHFAGVEEMAGTTIDGYIASSKTILIAPQPMLEKMLSKYRSSSNPLRRRLVGQPVESDIAVEYTSQPALKSLLKMTGMNAAQLRSDPETDEVVKTLLLDVKSATLKLQLRPAPSIRASVLGNNVAGATKIKEMLDGGMGILTAVVDNAQVRNELKRELMNELPRAVIELVDSAALRDLVRAMEFSKRGASVEVKIDIPTTVLELARDSAAQLVGAMPHAESGSRPWTLGKEVEWKRKDRALKVINREAGFVFLTGVQGALPAGSEVSLLPDPEGNWMFRGTDHAGLSGLAVAVPWFVDAKLPEKFELWKKGEPDFPKLIDQRDGFCVLVKIGGAFNGAGEQFRLRVGDDGYWRLNARSQAAGTRVRVMVIRSKQPGSFRGVVREHSWQNGQAPVRLIHRNEGIAILSGLSGAFAGGAEYARVQLHDDATGTWRDERDRMASRRGRFPFNCPKQSDWSRCEVGRRSQSH